ncbi:MAG TPA: glycine cleavage T C-terminal barrel domain-containing protein, partial [Candidatus Omnitrophota bacterium]|nr:glycine cleavage T C-terminal barrel domain-containing protein [Candidatus Omnitrophota bacterium]
DRVLTQRFADMPLKSCRYGLMLNAQGGVKDDLVVFRLAVNRWMLVVNAGTMESDAAHIQECLSDRRAFQNVSDDIVKLDVQGPRSRDVLRVLIPGIEKLDYYTFDEFCALGQNMIVSRTGYTGELGYEIYGPADAVRSCWQRLLESGVMPAGLGVRDVLRLEMGYPLYGHELSETMSPLEAGLGKFMDWEKDFIGKEAVGLEKARGVRRKNVMILSDSRRAPRAGHSVFTEDGREIGVLTSGTFSPAFKKGVGLALVQTEHSQAGQRVAFGEKTSQSSAVIVRRPVYQQGSLKQ